MTDLVSLSKSIPTVTVDNEKTLTDFLYDDGDIKWSRALC